MTSAVATDIRTYMQEYFDAWTDGGTEKILAYYSDDVVIDLYGGPAHLEGKAAVAENFVVPFNKAFPGNIHKVRNFIHLGNEVVVEWTFVAVFKGEFGGIPATGKKIELPGCSVYTVEGGEITRGNLYFNGPTLLEQLKAPVGMS